MKKPKSQYLIRDHETLRAVSDPLRMQIVEMLLNEKQTVKQVAQKLGLAPSKLYYHFKALEDLGLIKVVDTRMVSNMQEKTYQSSHGSIEVDPALLTISSAEGQESIMEGVRSTIDLTREDLIRSLQARQYQLDQGAEKKPRRIILNRLASRVSEDRIAEFQDRLKELIDEFEKEDKLPRRKGLQVYAFTIALYPSFYFDGSRE